MIYLYLNEKIIKILSLKKTSFLKQEEIFYFTKKHEISLLKDGQPENIDLLASAIKEAVSLDEKNKDNKIILILPQKSFFYFRTQIPSDIAFSALNSFIADKSRAVLSSSLEEMVFDYFIKENKDQRILSFYGLKKDVFEKYQQAAFLINLKIVKVIPDTLVFFKLFEKTLRLDKKENILYVSFEKDYLSGYLYDNFGLLTDTNFYLPLKEDDKAEEKLKELSEKLEVEKYKINRIIISGSQSEKIRQDIFTKSVGIWTNPLKRIIANFYQLYLNNLIVDKSKVFPVLLYDVCFGAFVFDREEKFSLIKSASHLPPFKEKINFKFSISKKDIFLFIGSFVFSFLIFFLVFNFNSIKNKLSSKKISPTPTLIPTSTPSPTPSFKKEDLKIQVLNGSGVAGKAAKVKSILLEKGYHEIIIGNADNYDYQATVLKIKKSKSSILEMVKKDLKDYTNLFKEETLPEDDPADLVIIFGSDFK